MNPTMGRLETAIVNSPPRALLARQEIRRFRDMAKLQPRARVLEIGCGAGLTTRAIADILRPARLAAFDFDDGQVARARRRMHGYRNVEVRQASATSLPYGEGEFDAVLEIGVLHHIPGWRDALPEIARALGAGGAFCFAEPTKLRLTRGLYRIFPHPPEAMFEAEELRDTIEGSGLRVERTVRTLLWSVFGVARKAE